jgi:hypothetical protein
MTKQKRIDTTALSARAHDSQEKEAYLQLEKTPGYRVGIVAKVSSPLTSSLSMEIIIDIATEGGEVNLQELENTLNCMKALKARGYFLIYEDSLSVSAENLNVAENIEQEYDSIKSIMKQTQL